MTTLHQGLRVGRRRSLAETDLDHSSNRHSKKQKENPRVGPGIQKSTLEPSANDESVISDLSAGNTQEDSFDGEADDDYVCYNTVKNVSLEERN